MKNKSGVTFLLCDPGCVWMKNKSCVTFLLCDPGWCVCVFSSHSFWTSSSLDVPAGVTQEEGHTGFFIHLLSAVRTLTFLARRIQPDSFPSSTVKSNLVY